MILIPQLYLRNGKVVALEGTSSPLIKDDVILTARGMKELGAEALHVIDLGIPPVGTSPHLQTIKKLHEQENLAIYVGGGFKTVQSVESFIAAGVELVILGSVSYQQPQFLEEACKKFPGRIAVHIDVRGGKVTIPGYTVVANKTAFDYAERFLESGVRFILYSDTGTGGTLSDENYDNLLDFCKRVTARIVCTSEVNSISEIERIARLAAPRLDGLVLGKPLYEGKFDLRGAIAMVNDLTLPGGEEPTLTEM